MAGKSKIIFWNDRPKRQLRALLEFHLEYHSHKAAENFQKKLETKLDRIRQYPETGQLTRYKSVRRMRVDRSLFRDWVSREKVSIF